MAGNEQGRLGLNSYTLPHDEKQKERREKRKEGRQEERKEGNKEEGREGRPAILISSSTKQKQKN